MDMYENREIFVFNLYILLIFCCMDVEVIFILVVLNNYIMIWVNDYYKIIFFYV